MISGWRKSVAALQQCQIGLKNGNEVWNSKMAKTDITLITRGVHFELQVAPRVGA